jgi:hypothetical protein
MREMEAPRTSAVWAGLGIVLWLVLGLTDMADHGASWRTAAYALLEAGAIYVFVRAIGALRNRRTPPT